MGGGTVPPVTLMEKRKLTADQARAVQDRWVAARSVRVGVPAILSSADFEKPEALNINPKDGAAGPGGVRRARDRVRVRVPSSC